MVASPTGRAGPRVPEYRFGPLQTATDCAWIRDKALGCVRDVSLSSPIAGPQGAVTSRLKKREERTHENQIQSVFERGGDRRRRMAERIVDAAQCPAERAARRHGRRQRSRW